jgi:hypothetical protein
MKLIPLAAGETIELRHPLGGASPLDLTAKLRQIPLTKDEAALYTQVSQQKAELSAKAAAYSATKLRDELELAKQDVAAQTTPEGLEAALATVAKLAGMAETPAIAKAVEREANLAIAPQLAQLDQQLVPLAERLIAELRTGLEKAAAKFNVGGLLDFIEDQHLGQLASYVGDRIAASHAQLNSWQLMAASEGSEAFLRDLRNA